jgi:hypothetical protein
MKKSLVVVVSMLFSAATLAHSGHTPFEFSGVLEAARHMFTNSYHIVVMLTISMAFIVSAVIVSKRKQVLTVVLMVLGLAGSMLGMGLLLS